jgi:hypothetical protein
MREIKLATATTSLILQNQFYSCYNCHALVEVLFRDGTHENKVGMRFGQPTGLLE